MRTVILIAALLGMPTVAALAADSGSRTYADPDCSSRTVDPAKCVLDDGPRRTRTVAPAKDELPVAPTQLPASSGSSFSAKEKAPVPAVNPADSALSQKNAAGIQPAPRAGTSFSAAKPK